nr:WRKY12713 [Atractylodes chinensis]
MDENRGLSSSAPSRRPSIKLPAGSTIESLFTGGGSSGPGASPGPMTLVSNFFSENDPDSDCRSFSQLLSGAMLSPAEIPDRRPSMHLDMEHSYSNKQSDTGSGGGGGNVDFHFSNNGRPSSLVVTQPSMFTIPPGLSPASLLDSPGFFPPTQGSIGMSHQRALAQVTAQAAQVHTQAHTQPVYPSLSVPPSSLPQIHSFTSNATTYQRLPPAMPDHNTAKESSDLSNSDNRYQPSSVAVDKPADDGYNWRKYGQKQVKGSEYPRSYYKCTHPNCPVKKQVERSVEGLVTEIIYKGQHNHQPPQSKRGKDTVNGTSGQYEQGFEGQTGTFSHSRKDQESSQATYEHSGSSDSEEVGNDVTRVDERHEEEPQAKRRNTEVRALDPVSSHRTVTEPRIIVQTTSEVDLLDDGYRWRKYGQKVVKGNPHPRSYYKCTSQGCNVRKHVERAASDPKAVITTYEGKHNHDVPAAKNSSHTMATTNISQPQPPNYAPTGTHSLIRRPEYPNRQQPPPSGLLQFKEEQIT